MPMCDRAMIIVFLAFETSTHRAAPDRRFDLYVLPQSIPSIGEVITVGDADCVVQRVEYSFDLVSESAVAQQIVTYNLFVAIQDRWPGTPQEQIARLVAADTLLYDYLVRTPPQLAAVVGDWKPLTAADFHLLPRERTRP
jgi:hypothetical protein